MNRIAKNIPQIRFPGFTNAWEQHKWCDNITISTEMVDPTTGEYDEMPHIAPGNIESFTGRILNNVKTVKEEQLISGKFRFRPGDVVYGKINPQLGKYFYANVDGLTSADAYVLNGKNGMTQKFLFFLLQTEAFFKYSVSVSRRSGMPKINRDELNAFDFLAPSTEEQERIGNFLLDIDKLLNLHQQKCIELKSFKTGLLQQMFPQHGDSVPRIRFPEFSDPWKQRKLCEICKEKLSNGIMNNQSDDNTKIKHINVINMYTPDKIHVGDLTSSAYGDEALKKCNVEVGDIFLTRSSVKPAGIAEANILLDSGLYVFDDHLIRMKVDKENYNPIFVNLSLGQKLIKSQFIMKSKTTAFTTIGQEDIANTIGVFPSIEEQRRIANFFADLNSLIALHQRTYSELKLYKSGLLQKMFA